jgi:dTDP-glucose 4,6-dehydratase
MLEIIVDGQRNLIRQLSESSRSRILFTSSGAVYGRLPQVDGPVTEDYRGGPNPLDPKSAYHEGKRVAELLLSLAHQEALVDPLIARLFAFVGPLLPLNEHFAIGNFLRDALKQQPIHLTGDGSPIRSYQYPTDMAVWLWAIAARGEALRAYNVGSANGLSLRQVATSVSQNSGGSPVIVAREFDPRTPVDYYVPDVDRITAELGLENLVDLDEAIRRTLKWHKQQAI